MWEQVDLKLSEISVRQDIDQYYCELLDAERACGSRKQIHNSIKGCLFDKLNTVHKGGARSGLIDSYVESA